MDVCMDNLNNISLYMPESSVRQDDRVMWPTYICDFVTEEDKSVLRECLGWEWIAEHSIFDNILVMVVA